MRKRRSKGRPTIADVAARAGVGAITVSRALRQPSQVSPALRKKIDAAVRDLDYVPDLNARALASRRTNLVAVLIPALTQNIFTDVLRGIYDGVEDSGLRIEIANTRYDREIEERAVAAILRHAPAGVVVSGVDQSAATRQDARGRRMPGGADHGSDRRSDSEDHRLLARRGRAPDDRAPDRLRLPPHRVPGGLDEHAIAGTDGRLAAGARGGRPLRSGPPRHGRPERARRPAGAGRA